ncbi:hypothetical protein [Acidilobus saccharovorans]|uniref:hypothetical protein n=1 Tax=Acidilobus saccharovorans TaxID=242703 RepID=UPI0011D0EC6F|nr:hypothetical protein [Acidilobus saccharovorans]
MLSGIFRWPSLVPPLVGAFTAALSFVFLRRASREFETWLSNIISVAVGSGEDEGDYGGGEGMEDNDSDEEYDNEDVFLVYYLVSNIAREVYGRLKSIEMVAFTDDLVLFYPEPFELGSEGEDEGDYYSDADLDEPDEPEAELLDGDKLVVKLPAKHFAQLVKVVQGGDGEVAVVNNEEELRSLYRVAKAIAEADINDEGLASYSAYKALLKMIRSSRLSVPEQLKDLMPFESRDLRRRVKEQVMEEGMI